MGKVQVLYVLGGGSNHGNAEFRWSLRSLERFARGADGEVNVEPVVVGKAPDWFRGDCLEMEDVESGRKADRIGCKIIEACRRGLVRGEFLMSADDHFLTRPRDFSVCPAYWAGTLLTSRQNVKPGDNYRVGLMLAREVLEEAGYPVMCFSQHFNTFANAEDWRVVEEMRAEAAGKELGYVGANAWALFGSCWMMNNRNGRPLVVKVDRKYPNDTLDLMLPGRAGRFAGFSIQDRAFEMPGFERWMDSMYPDRSRWET